MSKILLAVAAVVFAGVAATVAGAADHKSKPAAAPARSTVVTAAKEDAKGPAHKHRHAPKKAHHAHKAAPHHAK